MIDKSSPMPLYAQVRATILQKINSGEYKAGEKLPTEMELTHELGVGRVTVRTALAELESENRIEKRHGVGTFVADRRLHLSLEPILSLSYMIGQLGLPPDNKVLIDCDELARGEFLHPYWKPEETVHHVKRLRSADDTTFFIDDSYFEKKLYEKVIRGRAKDETEEHAFLSSGEATVEKITHDIYMRQPTAEEKKLLVLSEDNLRVVVLDRWLFCQSVKEPLSFERLVIGEKYLAMPFMD